MRYTNITTLVCVQYVPLSYSNTLRWHGVMYDIATVITYVILNRREYKKPTCELVYA